PQGRTLEFLPFNRPVDAGVKEFHQGRLREYLLDEPGDEVVSQSLNREGTNTGIKFIEHRVEVFAGAYDNRVRQAFFVREEAVKRAYFRAGASSDFGHCGRFVALFCDDDRRRL